MGLQHLWLTGYTPYPETPRDTRLPHEVKRLNKAINKTALGAESSLSWSHSDDVQTVIADLKAEGFIVTALEQTQSSIDITSWSPPNKVALLLGREVEGISPEVVALCDMAIEIPMLGKKESYNVVQAAAMALYHCRFMG